MQLRRPILLLFLAASLPLILLATAIGVRSLRQEQAAIEQEALEGVRHLSAVISRELLAQIDLVQAVTLWRALDEPLDLNAYREMAERLIAQRANWLTLRLTDRAGQILLDVTRLEPRESTQVFDLLTHQRVVDTKQPVVGRVVRGTRGHVAFAIRAPVLRDGEVLRVVTAVIRPDSIGELLATSDLPKDWVATVLDSDGYVAARRLGPQSLVGTLASERAREARENVDEGLYEGLTLEKMPTISAFHRLPVGGWSVHIGIPREIILAPLNRSQVLLGTSLIGAIGLVGVFSWLLMREIRLRRAEEATMETIKRREALGRMTGGVAHDFNNLLMIIQGSADLIKRRLSDPDRVRTLADSILAGAQRAQALTRQLLAFARRDTHERADFNLQDRLPDLQGLLRRAVRENVEVACSIPDDLWPIRADPNVLEVALINLAVNASDAMPQGGKLALSARNLTLTGNIQVAPHLMGDFVAIAVSDTGIGIASEDLPHVFEPFFTTKPVGKGTGLGLSQVYGFAEQSGGAVTVESRVQRGSTFTLYLPRADHADAAKVPAAAEATFEGERHILLVEDLSEVAEVASAMLIEAGYTVSRAVDAAAALSLLSRGWFDVVLSDIVMDGGMSGIELAARIRQQNPEMPVVLMTGYSQALSEMRSNEFPVVFKPFRPADLLRAIDAAIAGNSAAGPPVNSKPN